MKQGETIAHYEIEGTVGRGGMGVVYRARDTKLDRIVALKFLPSQASQDPQAKSRFVLEAKAASALDHPNICTIHDIAETEDGRLYIVMAHYDGKTLRQRLKSERFSITQCAAIGRQLAEALTCAHNAGIVHRDLKPENIMLLEDNSVKLLDFGLAKLTADADATVTKGTVGTITHMSPEQLQGGDIDSRTDIWAFGVVLYELLGGRNPFQEENSGATITAILNRSPKPLRSQGLDIPESLEHLVQQCLQKDRQHRPPDAVHLQRKLREVEMSGETWVPTRPLDLPPPPRRHRNRLLVGSIVMLALTALAAVALWGRWPAIQETPAVSSELLAVLPFSIRGSEELTYLEEGMVDLMSNRLDGLGSTKTVDPRVVFSRLQKNNLDPANPETGAKLASLVGAARYVTGDLVKVGDRITLTVYLHEATNGNDLPARATVEGGEDEVLQLIDTAAADLATHSLSAPADRLQRIAALTSHSLEATKAYLSGEKLLRAGQYREAAEQYETALENDPEFALAHYRKSLAADWIDAYDVRTSAERAFKYADGLPPRERSLLEALIHRRHGRNRAAEQAYKAILHLYPDEVDALLQIGEVYFHDNPRVGRSMLEAFDPFQRVLELDPSNANARIHLARLHALLEEHDALTTIAEAFAGSSAESERLLEVEALTAFGRGDVPAQNHLIEQLPGKPAPYLFYAAHGVTRFSRSAEGAQRILAAGTSDHALLNAVRAGLFLEQGRLEEFDEFLAGIPENNSACWQLYRAFVLTSGIVPRDESRMAALIDKIRSLRPEEIIKTSWLPAYEDMTLQFATFERDYHVAMLAIHLGREEEAREVMAEMERGGPLPGLGSLQHEALAGLEAEILLAQGDQSGALQALRTIRYEIPHAISVRSVADGSRTRFLRAELERAAGEDDVARAFYVGLDQSWSWWDTGYRPQAYWGLAKIAERQGQPEEARRSYGRLLDLWQDSDPALNERLAEVRETLASLQP